MNLKRVFGHFLSLIFILVWIVSCTATPPQTLPETTPTSTATKTQIPPLTQTPTSTQIPSPTPSPTPTQLPKNYIVKEGDTLGKIADLYQVPIISIILNNDIGNANLIYSGQVLAIPDSKEIPQRVNKEAKQIIVVLSLQKVFVYEKGVLINDFIVSTGLPNTPTVLGSYQIYTKYDSTRMTGEGYDMPNVPWTMYFYQGYSFHGTYWHSNFGQPMSHGCVNMKTEEAKWLYDWAPLGTNVLVLP